MPDITSLSNEDELQSELASDESIQSDLASDFTVESNMDEVVEVSVTYNGVNTDDVLMNVDNEKRQISATLTNPSWLEFNDGDWEEYKLKQNRLIITRDVHKYLNPFIDNMLIFNEETQEYENNIPAYKVTANDSIVIMGDEPRKCKVLIKGDR